MNSLEQFGNIPIDNAVLYSVTDGNKIAAMEKQSDIVREYCRVFSILASIVQYRFCEKFLTRKLDPTGRQYDQMTSRTLRQLIYIET